MPSTLSASNDYCSLSFDLVCSSTYANAPGFDAILVLQDVHWDGDHEHPISLRLEGIFMSRGELMRLCNRIDAWVDQPLEDLARAEFAGQFRFNVPSQDILLKFGKREDLITAQNQAITLRIESGRFSSQTSFVTDQSCLRLFSQELRREMETMRE